MKGVMDTQIKGKKSRRCVIIVVSGVFTSCCRAEIVRYYSGSSHIHSTEQYIFTPIHNAYLSVGFSLSQLLSVAGSSISSGIANKVAEHIQRQPQTHKATNLIPRFKRRPWSLLPLPPPSPALPRGSDSSLAAALLFCVLIQMLQITFILASLVYGQ